eukprot:1395338-Amorphochlora_amoeboformis.AAC.3
MSNPEPDEIKEVVDLTSSPMRPRPPSQTKKRKRGKGVSKLHKKLGVRTLPKPKATSSSIDSQRQSTILQNKNVRLFKQGMDTKQKKTAAQLRRQMR